MSQTSKTSRRESDLDRILETLATASAELEALVSGGLAPLTARQIEAKDAKLRQIAENIQQARFRIDPTKHGIIAISLGRPDAVARFFAFSFIERAQEPMSGIGDNRFFGSGVYAIYYVGDSIPSYAPIAGTETPIYVGKAIPADPTAETAFNQGLALWNRLRQHHKSLQAGDLDPTEFKFRRAIIQSGMEGAVEDFMIRLFNPVWNRETKLCYGIGKHGDAPATRKNKRSPWDTMHPGRRWATDTAEDQRSRETIIHSLAAHFRDHPPVADKRTLYRLLALQ